MEGRFVAAQAITVRNGTHRNTTLMMMQSYAVYPYHALRVPATSTLCISDANQMSGRWCVYRYIFFICMTFLLWCTLDV